MNVHTQRELMAPKIDRKSYRCYRSTDIRATYDISDQQNIGSGSYGEVFRATSRGNASRQVAVKCIAKESVVNLDALWTEVEVMHSLDHPNVTYVYEAFEDRSSVYIVMELCLGGNLSELLNNPEEEEIIGDEDAVSSITRQICGALAHCHGRGVCHRDLKPENVLLLSSAPDAPIKIADFGCAKHFHRIRGKSRSDPDGAQQRSRRRMKTFVGTLEYMAPEVIALADENKGETAFYDCRCDVWGLGVIAHMLLTDAAPFSLEEVAAFVAEDVPLPAVAGRHWRGGTENARDFVEQCLRPDFRRRPSAAKLLEHPFLAHTCLSVEGEVSSLDIPREELASRVNGFLKRSVLKRAALTAAVRHLQPLELEKLRRSFVQFDTNGDGVISISELKRTLDDDPGLAASLPSAEDIFFALDSDSSGTLDYTEFLAAAMDPHLTQDMAHVAFDAFDLHGDGKITCADLQDLVVKSPSRSSSKESARELAAEFGVSNSGGLGYDEFFEKLLSPRRESSQKSVRELAAEFGISSADGLCYEAFLDSASPKAAKTA